MDLEQLLVKIVGDATSFDTVIENTQKKIRGAAKALTDAARQVEREQKRMFAEGARLNIEMMTPLEKYKMALADLDEKLRMGAIFTETYDRKVRELKKTLPVNIKYTEEQAKADAALAKHQSAVNAALERSAGIYQKLRGPVAGYRRSIAELDKKLKEGIITPEVHAQKVQGFQEAARLASQKHEERMFRARKIRAEQYTPYQQYKLNKHELESVRRFLPEKIYTQLLSEENRTLQDNKKALETAGKLRGTFAEAQKLHNQFQARANELVEKGLSGRQRYNRDMADLNRLYKANYIGVRDYTSALRTIRRENDFFAQSMNQLSFKMRVVSSGIARLGGAVRSIGTLGSVFATAPLVGFATKGIQSLTEFDDAMTYSLSIAENVTPRMRRQMEDLAVTMSKDTAHSAIELAQAYYELISAGLSAEGAMRSLATVSQYATVGNMNLAGSVKQLAKATAAMGLMGRTADETAAGMKRVANVLVQAATMTTGSISDMQEALVNAAAPQARALGMSLEDTVAVLMHYIQVGESASATSEHFAIGMRLLGTAANRESEFWRQQNLELYTATGQMRKFTDVLRDMQKIYLNMAPEGRTKFLENLGFRDLSQRSLLTLLTDPDAANSIDKAAQALKGTESLTDKFAGMMKSLGNQFKTFFHDVQNLSMEVARMTLPYLQQLIEAARAGIQQWEKWDGTVKKSVVTWGIYVAAIGPALAIAGSLISAIAGVLGGFSALATMVATIGPMITAAMAPATLAAVVVLPILALALVAAAGAYFYFKNKILEAMETAKRWSVEMQTNMKAVRSEQEMLTKYAKDYGDAAADAYKKARKELQLLRKMEEPASGNNRFQTAAQRLVTVQAYGMAKAERLASTGQKRLTEMMEPLKKQEQALSNLRTKEQSAIIKRQNAGVGTEAEKRAGTEVEYYTNLRKSAEREFDRLKINYQFSASLLANRLREEMKKQKKLGASIESIQRLEELEKAARGAADEIRSLGQEVDNTNTALESQRELLDGVEKKLSETVSGMARRNKVMEFEKSTGYQATKNMIQAYEMELEAQEELDKGLQNLIRDYGENSREVEAYKATMEKVMQQTKAALWLETMKADMLEKEKRLRDQFENKDPQKKFAQQMDDLKDALAAGLIKADQYQKELRKLRSEMMKEFKIDFKVGGIEAMQYGTAATKGAIEDFLMMQQAAMTLPSQSLPGQALRSQPPQANSVNPKTKFGSNTERLQHLASMSGLMGADARRKLSERGLSLDTANKRRSSEIQRLTDLANKGGNLGYHAQRTLYRNYGYGKIGLNEMFGNQEVERLQSLAEKGGSLGAHAKQKLKEMGKEVKPTEAAPNKVSLNKYAPAETKAQETERGLLKQIAKNTGITAKKKEVVVEPANLT